MQAEHLFYSHMHFLNIALNRKNQHLFNLMTFLVADKQVIFLLFYRAIFSMFKFYYIFQKRVKTY